MISNKSERRKRTNRQNAGISRTVTNTTPLTLRRCSGLCCLSPRAPVSLPQRHILQCGCRLEAEGGPCLQLELTLMRRRRRFKANTLSRAALHRCLRESADARGGFPPPPRPPLSSVERRRTPETRKRAAVPLRPCSESELIREHFSFVSPSRPPQRGRRGAKKQISLTPTETRGALLRPENGSAPRNHLLAWKCVKGRG